jgi:hypothetical protein
MTVGDGLKKTNIWMYEIDDTELESKGLDVDGRITKIEKEGKITRVWVDKKPLDYWLRLAKLVEDSQCCLSCRQTQ